MARCALYETNGHSTLSTNSPFYLIISLKLPHRKWGTFPLFLKLLITKVRIFQKQALRLPLSVETCCWDPRFEAWVGYNFSLMKLKISFHMWSFHSHNRILLSKVIAILTRRSTVLHWKAYFNQNLNVKATLYLCYSMLILSEFIFRRIPNLENGFSDLNK